jgi:hypothetical protein
MAVATLLMLDGSAVRASCGRCHRVWQQEFDTDDAAYAEFMRSVDVEGLDAILRDPKKLH